MTNVTWAFEKSRRDFRDKELEGRSPSNVNLQGPPIKARRRIKNGAWTWSSL
jgi:hypothetical protein